MDIGRKSFTVAFPVTREHCGIPMANGSMGCLLFGQDCEFDLEFSLAACWDHRGDQVLEKPVPYRHLVEIDDPYDSDAVNAEIRTASTNGNYHRPYCGTRIGGGRFTFTTRGPLREMTLAYGTGVVTVVTDAGSFSLALLPDSDVVMVNDADDVVLGMRPEPMWLRVGEELLKRGGYEPPAMLEGGEASGWFQPLPADPGTLALAKRVRGGWQVTSRLCNDVADANAALKALAANDALELRWGDVRRASAAWWKAYWERQPEIHTPDDFVNTFYVHALYKFGCATNPGGIAAGLQGPWLEDYQVAPWGGDYHFNVNEQQIYSLAYSTGNLEHLLPMFDMLESAPFQAAMRQNARMLFGIDDGLLMTHAVDDRGWQVGWMSMGSVLDFACGGWTGLLYWQYYRYSGDLDFLARRAMPFMRGVMRVFEEALEERDGQLSLPLSISAEYGCTFKMKKDGRLVSHNAGRDPSSQLSCIHALANALLEGCRLLGQEPKPIWLDIKARLPHMTTVGEGAERHIAIWEGQDLDVCHRHHSHLSLIYPFDITAELTDEEQQWLTEGIDIWILRGMGQWSEWCYPWAIQLQARRGFRDATVLLLELWKNIFINPGLATSYLPGFQGITAHRRADMLKPKETHEVMQLDGTMAGATAMLDLLVFELGGVFHLFAGIPDSWTEASFDGVYLPGGWRISAERKAGRLAHCRITAGKAATMKFILEPGGAVTEVTLADGQTWEI